MIYYDPNCNVMLPPPSAPVILLNLISLQENAPTDIRMKAAITNTHCMQCIAPLPVYNIIMSMC